MSTLGSSPASRPFSTPRLKHHLSRIFSGGTPETGKDAYWSNDDSGVPWVAIGDMSGRESVVSTAKRITEEGRQSRGLSLLPKGTLIYSMYATLGHVAELGIPATINQALLGFEFKAGVNSQYVKWQLRYLQPRVVEEASSSTQDNLNTEKVRNLPVPLPPLEQQHAIAGYLDRETARLDSLVAAKERVLGLLAEKRRALITHAVTRGLDPRATLRDSGIPWLGAIPAHWERGNLRRFATMKTGHTPDRREEEYWRDCDIPWFTLADVWQLRDERQIYMMETKERISELGLLNSAAELLPAGTVAFSRTASVGFSGIMPQPTATSQDFWNWVPGRKLLSEYLLYTFRAMRPEFERLAFGSTHRTIYQPEAASLMICVPPLEEQRVIVSRIAAETAKLDAMRVATARTIDLLKERRTAIIAAIMTGQRHVVNVA